MDNFDFKVGDRVIVPAIVTGTGEDIPGYIDNIELFCGRNLISISYIRPSIVGDLGTTISNPTLITKVP